MDLTVHTYGHIDSMFYTLNAIAMLMNHKFGEAVMLVMTMSSVAYYAMRMSYAGAGAYKVHLSKVVGMVAMVYFMLLPRADMMIYDHVSKKRDKVDNLPLGFALPVGILEGFGDLLTGGFEQAFTTVDSTNYRDYGSVFGARLIQESRSWRIRSPEFLENMGNFIDRCVMLDAMIGYHYTPEELLKSNDIWGLIKANAATLRQTSVRVGKTRSLMSCKAAAEEVIDPAFRLEIESLERKSRGSDIAEAGQATYVLRTFDRLTSNFKKNIELSFASYVGSNANAENLIRQQMLMNAIKNYSDDYGYARASATQESNWRIVGDLAGTYLPILMSVLKGLVYSSFIFMLPMLIMSGGWGRYLGYLTLVASFQLWAPLNAVLNMFIDIYSSTTLKAISDQIVSFSTMSRIGNYTDKIVAVASGLQLAIPFLAFSIIQGGVGGFIHLAGTITGASQSAASQAANESVTGNKGFDNYSTGNRQLYNQGGFKTDWNESYAAGASSYQHTDGTMEKVTGGGNTLFQSGVGLTISGGGTKVAARESVSSQLHQAFSENQSMLASDQRALGDTIRSSETTSADYIKRIAAAESSGHKIDYSMLGDKAEDVREAVTQVRNMGQRYDYGWNQDLTGVGDISIGGSLGIGGSSGAGGRNGVSGSVNGSGSLGGSVKLSNSSSQSYSDDNVIGRDKNVAVNYSNITKALSSEEFAKTNNLDTSYSEDLRKNFEKQQSLEKSIGVRQEQAAHYSNAINYMHSKDSSLEQDKYQELQSKVSKILGVSTKDAHNMIENNDPRVASIRRSMESVPANSTLSQINSGKESVSGERALQSLNNFSVQHQQSINTDPTRGVKERAESSGLKTDAKHLDSGGLEQKVDNIIQGNREKIDEARSQHAVQEAIRQQKINTLEKNRIGQGKFAKFFGVGGETNLSTIDSADGKSTITEIRKVDNGSTEKAGQIVDKKK